MLFIDRKGIIRAQFTGGDQEFFKESNQATTLKAEAMKYLSEPAVVTKARAKRK